MMSSIYSSIITKCKQKKKMLALLIDPDDVVADGALERAKGKLEQSPPDFIFVGGSVIIKGNLDKTIEALKSINFISSVPIIIFPGDCSQLSVYSDATLLLSLLSGRNPEYLIGQHVKSAIKLRQLKQEIIPTAYLLIDGGAVTSVQSVSNTLPIPSNNIDLVVSTALAGEQLGMKMIYLEAGSGAAHSVPDLMIRKVKEIVDLPLIVGGGIRSAKAARNIWKAGADLIVVGNGFITNPALLQSLTTIKEKINLCN